MKKGIKKLFVIVMATIIALSTLMLSACGRSIVDPNKIQIYVYVVSDGYGHQHMETLVNNFVADHPEYSDYQFIYEDGQDGIMKLPGQLEAGICNDKNIYVGPSSSIQNMIRKGQVLDLSSVYEKTVDGEKVKDKVLNYDLLKKGYCDMNGNGMYAIPHATTISSAMVFDFKHFLENGYMLYAKGDELSAVNNQVSGAAALKDSAEIMIMDQRYFIDIVEYPEVLVAQKDFGNYKQGDVILSKGRDGVYGTYDDGQTQTVSEFSALLKRITDNGDFAFVYSTQYATANTPQILYHMLYQNLGYENVKVLHSFNGQLKDKSGTTVLDVNRNNAYQMWQTDIVKNAYTQAAKFFDITVLGHNEGVDNVSKYLDTATWDNGPTTSLSHTDAQADFAVDHHDKGAYGKPETAFLCDGGWWENESYNVIVDLYGSTANCVEHRFYLTPVSEGQIEDADTTLFQGSAGGSCMLYLNNYPAKVKTDAQKQAYDKAVFDFMAYCCSDEALNIYTGRHGIKANFDYEITPETMDKLTPFQKNIFEMLSDTEHIKIVDGTITGANTNPMRWYGEIDDRQAVKSNQNYENPYTAMSGKTPYMTWNEYAQCVADKIVPNYAATLSAVNDFLAKN